jgi:hypothetical protein
MQGGEVYKNVILSVLLHSSDEKSKTQNVK